MRANRVFHDWEFIDDGETIMPISVGMVEDRAQAQYYGVFAELDEDRVKANPWLMENVWPHLPLTLGGDHLDHAHPRVKPRAQIAEEVRAFFVGCGPDVEAWAWNGSFDAVCLSQLYGSLQELPPDIPKCTFELKQEARRLGVSKAQRPVQDGAEHHALADALHDQRIAQFLDGIEAPAG